MVIIPGEPIGFKYFRIIRNCSRFGKGCPKLFYGFAEVFCGAVLRVSIATERIDLCRSLAASRIQRFVGCEEVSRSRAQKDGTSKKQGRVLSPRCLLRRPTLRSICSLQREPLCEIARRKTLGQKSDASQSALHRGGLRRSGEHIWLAIEPGTMHP